MKKEGETRVPFIVKRKLQDTGTSFTVSLPKEWFESHGLDPKKVKDLLLIGDENILILHPKAGTDLNEIIENYIQGKLPLGKLEKTLLERFRSKEK